MSLFGELDVASANENPYYKEDGPYTCQLTGAELKTAKNGVSKGLALKYTILEGDKKGLSINEWKPVPTPWNLMGYTTKEDMDNTVNHDDEVASNSNRSLSYLKARLIEFGIPPEEMNDLEPKTLLELPHMIVTIRNKNDRENITGVELITDSTSSVGTTDPFSS